MILLICFLLYIIPILIISYGIYTDMEKEETFEHYCSRQDIDDVFWIVVLFPVFNWITVIIAVVQTICEKIKHWKK